MELQATTVLFHLIFYKNIKNQITQAITGPSTDVNELRSLIPCYIPRFQRFEFIVSKASERTSLLGTGYPDPVSPTSV